MCSREESIIVSKLQTPVSARSKIKVRWTLNSFQISCLIVNLKAAITIYNIYKIEKALLIETFVSIISNYYQK